MYGHKINKLRVWCRSLSFALLCICMCRSFQANAQCTVEAGMDTTICSGHKVKFVADTTGGNPTAYAWSSIPAGYTSGSRNVTVLPSGTTTYVVSVTGNGCNAVDSVTVTVNPSPAVPTFTYNTTVLCAETALSFIPNPDSTLTYKWSFGDGQKDSDIFATHTFYYYGTDTASYVTKLTVTNSAGCTSSFSDTLKVKGIPHGALVPGTGTDSTTFNGDFTFTRCILSGQQSAGFSFVNKNTPSTGVSSTIIWGDTGVAWTSDTPWTQINHSYALGKYDMTYIVQSTVNGCADTLHYKIFVGSNPSVGFGIQGSTSICGLNPIVFYVDNFLTNPSGTIYKVTFNDGTPPLIFGQPPPDSIVHLFATSSCGFSSTNGINTYANSYSASIVASNPCGVTSASVLPIYVSYPPLPGVVNDTVCQGQPSTITNATINGGYASPTGCNTSVSILWNVQPNTGWALVGGSLGNNNGYTGPNFDPSLWTAGSNTLNIIFDSLGTYNVILVAANGCGPDTISQSICITTPPSPSFTLTPGIGCAPFIANAVNTTPPVQGCHAISYNWDITPLSRSCINDSVLDYKITGNNNTPAIHFYNQGIYSVSLNAANVCGNYSSVALIDTVKDKPQLTLTIPGAICAGDSLLPLGNALACSGTISGYSWAFQGGIPSVSDSLNPGSISINSPGGHQVTFSASNECGTRTVTDVVVIDTLPVANAGPDKIICSDSSVQIGANPVNGWIYIWNPPTGLSSDTLANPEVTLSNNSSAAVTSTYVLTVSNAGGCFSTDSVKVTVFPNPVVNAGPSKTICAGTSVKLTGTSGGGTSSVTWSSANGGTFSNTNADTTIYTPAIDSGSVVITLSAAASGSPCPGQSDTLVVTVLPVPVVNAGPDQQLCSGNSVQLGVPPVVGISYLWSPATGLNSNTLSNPVLILSNTGLVQDTSNYILTASNGYGCSVSDTVSIATFPAATVNAGPSQPVCAGFSIQLAGAFGGTASSAFWTSSNGGVFSNPASVNSIYTPAINFGTTVLTLTTNQPPGPCPAVNSKMIVTVSPTPVANPGLNDTICNGYTSQIGGAAQTGYHYNWSPSTGLTDSTVANPGVILTNPGNGVLNQTYTLIVNDNGCKDTAQVTVSVFPTPDVNAGPPVSTCQSDTVRLTATASGANSYLWTSPAGTFASPDSLSTLFIPAITNGIAVATLTIAQIPAVCPAAASTVNVSVTTFATLNHSFNQSICSGIPLGAINLNGNPTGTTFSWTAFSPNGITGLNLSGSGTIIPEQTLVNDSATSGLVIYNISPLYNGCSGVNVSDTIRVLPQPQVILPPTQTICSGATSAMVPLTSLVANTAFSWTASASNNLSGFTGSGSGNIPAQTISNSGNYPDSIVYIINPSALGCQGPAARYVIRIEPAPGIIFTPAPQTVCSGQPTQLVNLTSNVPATEITWSATVPVGIVGAVATGSEFIPSQTFYNNNTDSLPVPLTIHYTAQITTTGFVCTGTPAFYTITVMPVPSLGLIQSQVSGCPPLSVSFVPVTRNYGPPDSLTFVWGDLTPNTVLHPNSIVPEWATTPHQFYSTNNGADTFHVQLIAHSQCLDTSVTGFVTLLPSVVNAFFTDSPATGCEPLQVTFHDLSTGAGLLTWCFNFDSVTKSCTGPGQVDSAQSIFNHTFTAGTYTVALFANAGYQCAADTVYQVITVIPSPAANFVFADSLCTKIPVAFTNLSTISGGGSIAQTKWYFGNGSSSYASNPVNTYDTAGIYQVCLSVANSFGCADSLCKPITVLDRPNVGFIFADTCLNAQPVQFLNTSTGAANFIWSFGDGNISYQQNPLHAYGSAGNYPVILIGSSLGCADTVSHIAAVYPVPVAAFTFPDTYSCGFPVNVPFTNTSAGTNAYFWSFGNGANSTNVNPQATYTSAGTFVIGLTAINNYGCADTVSNSFTVYPMPVIDSINISPAQGCQPLNVHFGVTGNDLNKLVWNFGDGNTLTSNLDFASHYYGDTGTYSVQVTAYSYQNCNVSITLYDTIVVHINPTAAFTYYINENVEPENGTTEFFNQSQNSTSYLWNFGDGTTSTDTNPVHTFSQTSYFNVLLIATTPYGCIDSVYHSIYIIEKSLYVPNVVAPDFNEGSSLVKVWMPAGEGLAEYHAQVFNKWGELLWESKLLTKDHQPAEGWDGTYQGKEVQQDAYVWKVEAVFLDGTRWKGMSYKFQKERKTIGSVTVIR